MYKESGSLTAEILDFNDCGAGWASQLSQTVEPTMDYGKTMNTNDGFFGRPVKILSYQWQVGIAVFQQFDPWSLFCEDPRVANRLAHFKNLRGNLHVKIMLNGNPFYYGRALASYTPMHVTDNYSPITYQNLGDVMLMSQKPHVWLNPTTSEGGELVLNYIYPKNFINITKREWNRLGSIDIAAVNPLKHANGLTDSITVTVFAYMTDVVLSGATTLKPGNLLPQGDEYGLISGPASTLANWSGKLSDAPYIGKYARATSIASGAISSIASLFGFSRPRELAVCQSHTVSCPEVSNTSGSDTARSMAFDPKKEITIDPRVVFSPGVDEMALVPLACRQSYLTTFDWNLADPAEKHLCSFRVTPVQGRTVSGITYITPSAWVAMPFEYWTGSMLFRFQVVASAYHRGRLRFTWDPEYYQGTAYNTAFSHIIDITTASDFTFKVGWGQDTNYLNVLAVDGNDFDSFSLSPWTDNPGMKFNGTIHVSVVTELTCAQSSGDIVQINAFSSMCEDFEVASPSDTFLGLATLNSSIVPPVPPSGNNPTNPSVSIPPNPIVDSGAQAGSSIAVTPPLVTKVVPAAIALQAKYIPGDISNFPQYTNAVGVDVPGKGILLMNTAAESYTLYAQSPAANSPFTFEVVFENNSTNVRTLTFTNMPDQGAPIVATLAGSIGATVTVSLPVIFNSPGFKQVPVTIDIAGGGGRILAKTVKTQVSQTHEPTLLLPTALKKMLYAPTGTNSSTVTGSGSSERLVFPPADPIQYFKYPGDWVTGSQLVFESDYNLTVGDGSNIFRIGVDASPSATAQKVVAWDPWTGRDTDVDFGPDDIRNSFIRIFCTDAPTNGNFAVPGSLTQLWYWRDTTRSFSPNTTYKYGLLNNLFRPQGDIYQEIDQTPMENAPVKEVEEYYLGPTEVCNGANQIYFGEQVASWRQVLKRYTHVCEYQPSQARGRISLPNLPVPTASSNNAGGFLTFPTCTMHEWVTSAYVAKRGGARFVVSKVVGAASNATGISSVSRRSTLQFSGASIETAPPATSASNACVWAGSAIENINRHGVLQVEAPSYSKFRFIHSRSKAPGSDDTIALTRPGTLFNFSGSPSERYNISWAAAEDFSTAHFLCTPRLTWVGLT